MKLTVYMTLSPSDPQHVSGRS